MKATARRLIESPLVRSTLLVAALGLVAKSVSLLKDMLVVSRFGLGRDMDQFTLALNVLSFPVSLLAGNLGTAFIPVYVGLLGRGMNDRAVWLQRRIMTILLSGLTVSALILLVAAPLWVPRLVPGWSKPDQSHFLILLAILLPILPLSGGILFFGACLQGQRRFKGAALSPAMNTMLVVGLLCLPLCMRIQHLAVWVGIGALAEFILLKTLLGKSENQEKDDTSLRIVGRLYLPSIGAGLFMSTTTLVDMMVAALLPAGAVGTLAYANKIPTVIISLSATALATTVFPSFSHLASLKQWEQLKAQALKAIKFAVAGGVLLVLAVGILTPWLIRILFQRGALQASQAHTIASVQIVYLLQVPFYIGAVLSVRLLQSLQEHRLNFIGTILNGLVNLALDLVFLPYMGAAGIALSTVCVYVLSFAFLATCAFTVLNRRQLQEQAP